MLAAVPNSISREDPPLRCPERVRFRGQPFQKDAAINIASPLKKAASFSMANFPARINAEAHRPKRNGPYPRRFFARNANSPNVPAKNNTVRGNKMTVSITKPNPNEARIPA